MIFLLGCLPEVTSPQKYHQTPQIPFNSAELCKISQLIVLVSGPLFWFSLITFFGVVFSKKKALKTHCTLPTQHQTDRQTQLATSW